MLRKTPLFIGLLLQAALAAGQTSKTVILPPTGDFVLFGSHGYASAAPTNTTRSPGGSAQITLDSGDDRLYAWEKKSGNLASIDLAGAKNGWSVKTEDFKDVAQVAIRVVYGDKPVSAADVKLDDGRRTLSGIVDPSSDGTAEFFDVKPGALKVTVSYRTTDKQSKSVTQVINLSLNRPDVEPRFPVALADAVATASPAVGSGTGQATGADTAGATTAGSPAGTAGQASSAPGAGPAGPKGPGPAAPPENGNPIGIVVVYLIAAAAAVFAIYTLMRHMKNNPDAVSSKLEQLGVQIPKPGNEPLNDAIPAVPVAMPKPEPPQKIMLGDGPADPIPIVSPSTAVSVSEPSLVAEGGVAIPLMDGETTVGREVGLGLSLHAETTVSRLHAKLLKVGNEVTLTDLGSTNGTFVNGARLQSPVVLRPGDAVQFGSARFHYQA